VRKKNPLKIIKEIRDKAMLDMENWRHSMRTTSIPIIIGAMVIPTNS
jgi:hypothetical protein